MRVLLISLLAILTLNFDWGTRHFNRLNKLYQKDVNKCLQKALSIQKWDKNSASSYYFSSLAFAKLADEQKTTRKQYSYLGKSFNDARKLESLNNELMQKEQWKKHLENLDVSSLSLFEDLKKEGKSELITSLNRKRKKIGLTEFESSDVNLLVEEKENVPENFRREAGEFYGLPIGDERILIYSAEGEQEVLKLINAERKKLGMVELIWEEELAYAARYHSYDMATQNYFDHQSYDRINGKLIKVGKTFDRIRKFYSKTFVNSENIAAGSEEGKDTYRQWYNSKGHYDNMFNPSSKRCGIGVWYDSESTFQYYWTFCTAQ